MAEPVACPKCKQTDFTQARKRNYVGLSCGSCGHSWNSKQDHKKQRKVDQQIQTEEKLRRWNEKWPSSWTKDSDSSQ